MERYSGRQLIRKNGEPLAGLTAILMKTTGVVACIERLSDAI